MIFILALEITNLAEYFHLDFDECLDILIVLLQMAIHQNIIELFLELLLIQYLHEQFPQLLLIETGILKLFLK